MSMNFTVLAYLLAFGAGVSVLIQQVVKSNLRMDIGSPWWAGFVSYLGGTLVMKWTILPSGKTAQVSVQSEEFKSTYLANCLTILVKGMSFPRHKVQGEPIVFPFKF